MARILCINDYKLYSELIALMLQRKGQHEVRVAIVPFALREIEEYQPDLIILNLVRKMEALRSPLADFYAEVDGAKSLRALKDHLDVGQFPLIITAVAVEERELPPGYEYLAFIEVPSKFDYMLETLDRIVATRGAHLARE